MHLTEAPIDVPLRLTAVGVGDPLRMRELGLRVGCVLTVAQKAGFGGRVLALGPTRIALDHVSCAALDVEVLPDLAALPEVMCPGPSRCAQAADTSAAAAEAGASAAAPTTHLAPSALA